jgi:hypothetical protein
MLRLMAKFSAGAVAVVSAKAVPAIAKDPFAFLAPDVAISPVERARLDRGETLVRVVPGRDGYLSLSASVRVNASGERLVAWASHVEALQKGRYVPEIGRLSSPPRADDLVGLTVEADDLEEIRKCIPGDCGIKLSAEEMTVLRAAPDRAALEAAFRSALVQRATAYLERGDASALPYHDHKRPIRPEEMFVSLLQRLTFFPMNLACYTEFLTYFPGGRDGHVTESFLYWSKESLGMKPIVSITHFSVSRIDAPTMPSAVIVAKQVYASHYKNASMTVTTIAESGSDRYLVYLHRSHVDALQGFFGALVRRVLEHRVKAEAPGVLHGLRKRLESGEPNTTLGAH